MNIRKVWFRLFANKARPYVTTRTNEELRPSENDSERSHTEREVDSQAIIGVNFKNSFLGIDRGSERLDQFHLPTYHTFGNSISENRHLVYVDVLKALADNYWRARLLIYEISRKARTLSSFLSPGSFKLNPDWVPLDRALADVLNSTQSMEDEPEGMGVGKTAEDFPYYKLQKVYDEAGINSVILKHKEMVLADPEIVKTLELAKTTFLNLDNEFRKNVIDPLKRCMIYREDIDIRDLEIMVRSTHTKTKAGCDDLKQNFEGRQYHLVHKAIKKESAKKSLLGPFV